MTLFGLSAGALTRGTGIRPFGKTLWYGNLPDFSTLQHGLVTLSAPRASHILFFNKTFIYLCTDGMTDQNNPEKLKFGSIKFKELLENNATLPISIQKEKINAAIDIGVSFKQATVDANGGLTVLFQGRDSRTQNIEINLATKIYIEDKKNESV